MKNIFCPQVFWETYCIAKINFRYAKKAERENQLLPFFLPFLNVLLWGTAWFRATGISGVWVAGWFLHRTNRKKARLWKLRFMAYYYRENNILSLFNWPKKKLFIIVKAAIWSSNCICLKFIQKKIERVLKPRNSLPAQSLPKNNFPFFSFLFGRTFFE